MILTEHTSVAVAALPIEALKDRLHMGTGFAESDLQDDLLENYLRAALSAIEMRAGRVLLQKQYIWRLTKWRDPCCQVLPVRPVSGVITVKLTDVEGAETTVPATDYRFQPDDISPTLEAVAGVLPAIPKDGTVEIVFEAGFGAAWADVPRDLAEAVLITAAHFYENRTGMGDGIPQMALDLIAPYRVLRILRGV